MKFKITMTILSTASLLLFSACAAKQSSSVNLDEKSEYELKQKASKAIEKVAGSLQMRLYSKVKEGGFANAASFCSINASSMAKKTASMLPEGVRLKRITDKPRNSASQASTEQLIVFNEIKTQLKSNKKFDMLIKQKAPNHFQVYKPIKIMGACLQCHGTTQTRNEEAYEIIAKKYPNDKAINYKLYDFRGAFLVDIIQ